MSRVLHHSKIIVWFILAFLFTGNANAQVYKSFVSLHEGYNEKYIVFTDRSLYVAGEKLQFAVFNLSDKEVQSANWSKVYYIELIKSDGTVLVSAKFPLLSKGTEGYISIPDNVATGYYFLRSYTRWMRNFSPTDYSYNRIKIINPYRQEIDNPVTDTSGASNVFISTDTLAFLPAQIGCRTDKKTYGNREKVVVSLEIPSFLKNSTGRYCISVARPGAVDTSNPGIKISNTTKESNYVIQYIPETEGLFVSGKIVFKNNSEAVKNAFVQLAVLGDDGDYLSYNTGNEGTFYFSLLPHSGKKDLFISARNASDDELEIRVDKDFANHNCALYTDPFYLGKEERDLAVEMMINSQVNKSYAIQKDTAIDHVTYDTSGFCFYGKPLKTVYIDDFIALPTLGEVFFELVPEVNIGKRKGVSYMVLTGHAKNNIDLASYSPLILLDRVPVSNLKDLLEVPPDKIQRIELLNDLYIKGNVIYGGIVSIFSRRSDLAGIKLPRNCFFFDFSGYYPQKLVDTKKYTDISSDHRIPDLRNCIYWNPGVYIKPGDIAPLELYTSDSKGDFEIVVRSLDLHGKILEGRCRFTVE